MHEAVRRGRWAGAAHLVARKHCIRVRRHLTDEGAELMVDSAALCDLAVVRVGYDNLVDRLVHVSRLPLLSLEARSQVLGHLLGAADVA